MGYGSGLELGFRLRLRLERAAAPSPGVVSTCQSKKSPGPNSCIRLKSTLACMMCETALRVGLVTGQPVGFPIQGK